MGAQGILVGCCICIMSKASLRLPLPPSFVRLSSEGSGGGSRSKVLHLGSAAVRDDAAQRRLLAWRSTLTPCRVTCILCHVQRSSRSCRRISNPSYHSEGEVPPASQRPMPPPSLLLASGCFADREPSQLSPSESQGVEWPRTSGVCQPILNRPN